MDDAQSVVVGCLFFQPFVRAVIGAVVHDDDLRHHGAPSHLKALRTNRCTIAQVVYTRRCPLKCQRRQIRPAATRLPPLTRMYASVPAASPIPSWDALGSPRRCPARRNRNPRGSREWSRRARSLACRDAVSDAKSRSTRLPGTVYSSKTLLRLRPEHPIEVCQYL